MENNTEKSFPLFKILYRNLLAIILTLILGALIGLGYSIMFVKPVHTYSRSLIFRTSVSSSITSNSASNNAALGKIYIEQLNQIITSPKFIADANEEYSGEGKVSAGAISISYNNESLIFKMSYSDTDRANAINKLDAVYNVTKNNIHEYIEAYSVALIDTDKNLDYSVDNGYVTSIMLGALICATICIIIVLAVNALDNTVKDKDEFESLTGVNVISFIDKEKTSK